MSKLPYFCFPTDWYKSNDVESARYATDKHILGFFTLMLTDALMIIDGTVGRLMASASKPYTVETYGKKHDYSPGDVERYWNALYDYDLIDIDENLVVSIRDIRRWYGEAIDKANRTAKNTQSKREKRGTPEGAKRGPRAKLSIAEQQVYDMVREKARRAGKELEHERQARIGQQDDPEALLPF